MFWLSDKLKRFRRIGTLNPLPVNFCKVFWCFWFLRQRSSAQLFPQIIFVWQVADGLFGVEVYLTVTSRRKETISFAVATFPVDQTEGHWFDLDASQADALSHAKLMAKSLAWLEGEAKQLKFILVQIVEVQMEPKDRPAPDRTNSATPFTSVGNILSRQPRLPFAIVRILIG
jgi:hypothetical protein